MKNKTNLLSFSAIGLLFLGVVSTGFLGTSVEANEDVCRNIETVKNLYEAFGKGDIDTIMGALSEDIQWDVRETPSYAQVGQVPYLVPRTGMAEVQEFFEFLNENLEFSKFDVQNIMGGGNQVTGYVKVEGNYHPTGKKLIDDEIHLFTFDDDGKLTRFDHFVDTAKALVLVTPEN